MDQKLKNENYSTFRRKRQIKILASLGTQLFLDMM